MRNFKLSLVYDFDLNLKTTVICKNWILIVIRDKVIIVSLIKKKKSVYVKFHIISLFIKGPKQARHT